MGVFKPTILTARVTAEGHDIVFSNMWSLLPLKSKATLKVGGRDVAMTDKLTWTDPNIPLFSVENVAPGIDTLKVFIIGVLSIKASIVINGRVVYQDEISALDRFQANLMKT